MTNQPEGLFGEGGPESAAINDRTDAALDGLNYEGYKPGALAQAHLERSPVAVLPCWCEIGRDHTLDEFMAMMDEFVQTEIAQAEAKVAQSIAEFATALDYIPDEPEYPHPSQDF